MSTNILSRLFRIRQRILHMEGETCRVSHVSGVQNVDFFEGKLKITKRERLKLTIPYGFRISKYQENVAIITDGKRMSVYNFTSNSFVTPPEHYVTQIYLNEDQYVLVYLANNKVYVQIYESKLIYPITSPPIKHILKIDDIEIRAIRDDGNWFLPEFCSFEGGNYYINMSVVTTDGKLLITDDFGNEKIVDSDVVGFMENTYIKKGGFVRRIIRGGQEVNLNCKMKSKRGQISFNRGMRDFVILENPAPKLFDVDYIEIKENNYKIKSPYTDRETEKIFGFPLLLSEKEGKCMYPKCEESNMICDTHMEKFVLFTNNSIDKIKKHLKLKTFLRIEKGINLTSVPFERRTVIHMRDHDEIRELEHRFCRSVTVDPRSTYLDLYFQADTILGDLYNYDYGMPVILNFTEGKDPRVINVKYQVYHLRDLGTE